jgi:2-iminobutanoate/2-iminopropanoate deaminase
MRRSIHIDEFKHKNPIPNAARIGNVIVSGLIRGVDPVTHAYPESIEQQCKFMFDNVRRTVEAGGGSIADIIKITVWMGQMQREPVNVEWLKMFPDPDTRPARQVMLTAMEPGVLVQCDFMAVLGGG